MAERDISLKAIRERWLDNGKPEDSETAHTLRAYNKSLDVPILLRRLGALEEPDPELGYTPPMVVTEGDAEIYAHCGDCGAPLGSIRPDGRLDTLFLNWERHAMTAEAHRG